MSPDNEPQPLTAPVLTHARMNWSEEYPNGFIHLDKKESNGQDLKTVGYVRGNPLAIGCTVNIQKGDKKTWEGTIISGPHSNDNGLTFSWSFTVQNKDNLPDPVQDDTVYVTVTNPNSTPTTSPPIAATPQPVVIP